MGIMKHNECFRLCIFSLCFFPLIPLYRGADTITGSQSLSGDQTIVSAGSNFKLGFFQPGNSPYYYIGIWYNKVSEQTVVWVANRENPITDKDSSELKILNGDLVLTDGSKTTVWSTNLNTVSSLKSIEVALLDTGNLVLRDGLDRNSSHYLWQSFDYPAHTWLPGSKIGFNKKKGKKQLLTSWKNTANPSERLYSLQCDPKGSQYVIMWNRTVQYWNSGAWNPKEHIFNLVPEMRFIFSASNHIYNFSYIDNENESYFIYYVYKPSIISRIVMDVSGKIEPLIWLDNSQQWNVFWSEPRQQCQVYAYCGAFGICNQNSLPYCTCLTGFGPSSRSDWDSSDYSGVCARKTQLKCGNSTSRKDTDRFWVRPSMSLLQNGQSVSAASLEECESSCMNNCSCTAYAYDDTGCSVWHGDLLNLQQLADSDTSGKTLYIRLAASEFPKSSHKKMVAGVVIGSVAGVVAILGLIFGIYWKQKRKSIVSTKAVEGSLVAFRYRDLQNATKNFSEKLGGGGFGSVFKGTFPDSSVIAVKKLEGFCQGEKQFRPEVNTIGTIQHVNLVRLRGFCSQGTKKLLVYDYMPNGSLDAHLVPEKPGKALDWKTRYQIALGTARGLAYLHEKCRDCIIHCDIKPENILLDAEFCPKVADFGLAKLMGREFSRVLTTMRGTRGYLAPEWISGVAITAKADVYSYGMMLFELISGRRNTEQSEDGKVKFFPTWAATKLNEREDILVILDPRLERNADAEELTKICKLACWCIQDDEYNRPSMGQVVQILEGVLDVNMPPTPRSLQVFIDDQDNVIFFTELSSTSSGQSSQTKSKTSNSSAHTSN